MPKKSKYHNKYAHGDKFGNWEVVTGDIIGSPAKCQVKCICGVIALVDMYSLVYGRSKGCGCDKLNQNAPNWKGTGSYASTVLYRETTNTGISSLDSIGIAMQQNNTCPLTGQTLSFTVNNSNARLSRIDSSQPFSRENAVWVHSTVAPLVQKFGVVSASTIASTVSNYTSNSLDTLGFIKQEK